MATKWEKWDAADYLDDSEARVEYLNAVLELNDPLLLQEALGDIARSEGMASIAEDTGLSRENLYRSLSGKREAYFSTIAKVIESLGLQLRVELKGV